LLRARRVKKTSYIPQFVSKANELKPFRNHGVDLLNMLIAHGQSAEDMSIFLYSVLDVPVQHTFFMNFTGEFNMRNFQHFQSKAKSESLTVLNTPIRVMDASRYEQIRCLNIVSCDMAKLVFDELPNLELLNVCYNRLEALPQEIGKCKKLKTLSCAHNFLKRLPSQLGDLGNSLLALDCSYNLLKRLPSKLVYCTKLKSLECNHNGIIELPHDIGLLAELEELHVENNKLSQLPLSVAQLAHLRSISFHSNPLLNIPTDFPEHVSNVQDYLRSLQDDPVPNKTAKLVLVGQEGVGKTTLLRALKKTFWLFHTAPNTPKTDGIDIKDIALGDITLRCFDCGGDVDFNETHNFFITHGALYLSCFNLAEYCISTVERNSFLLGRLQLWLQYIFSKVPSAQVIIIGTHADHPSLTRTIFEEIWTQLRRLLVKARIHHQQYFRSNERLSDCMLCQSDSKCLRTPDGASTYVNMAFEETASVEEENTFSTISESVVAFPHIVGYYEVSSVKPMGKIDPKKLTGNASIEHLKEAIKEIVGRLIQISPSIPRNWANVQKSLQNHTQHNPEHAVASLDEVRRISQSHGINEHNQLLNMLQFLKAQGSVLYFPQIDSLQDTVILDPEWLAKIFSSVVSFRDTGFDIEGVISQEKLEKIWREKQIDATLGNKVLSLLHHFGVCIPVDDGKRELFPCKLPIGDPDEAVWPSAPQHGEKQVTYRITFPTIIPPPFFNRLLIAVHQARRNIGDHCKPAFYSNKIMNWLALDRSGCSDCGQKEQNGLDSIQSLHKVLFEMVPYARVIQITTRGAHPCCLLQKINGLLDKVSEQFEGLGKITIENIVCPGCYMQGSNNVEKYSIKHLRNEIGKREKLICSNAHIHPDAKSILCGSISNSCLPLATIRPKLARQKFDYSSCPRLFIMLPVNKDGITFDNDFKLYTSSLMFDGYAVHLLCEFPDGYHVTRSPGYRLKDPKDFMKKCGAHVIDVFRLLESIAGSSVSPQYRQQTNAVTNIIANLIKEYMQKFPECKVKQREALNTVNLNPAITCDELRHHLHITVRPYNFGPLKRLKYGENILWLCNEHYRQMRIITLGTCANPNVQAESESSA